MINFSEMKKFFVFNLIGALILSALVAVVTILIGEFNEVSKKVLYTLFMVVIHSLISLAFVQGNKNKKSQGGDFSFFVNVLFILVIVSFLNSIFGIWDILTSELVWEVYQSCFVVGMASLYANILSLALNQETYVDNTIYGNYAFILIISIMLQPVIFASPLGDVFFRILGAMAIVCGTLTILTIIFYNLSKHRKH